MLALKEVKQYLCIHGDEQDAALSSAISKAYDMVMKETDANKNGIDRASPIVHIAELYAVSYLYEYADKANMRELQKIIGVILSEL